MDTQRPFLLRQAAPRNGAGILRNTLAPFSSSPGRGSISSEVGNSTLATFRAEASCRARAILYIIAAVGLCDAVN
jgi:hypothetical protein